MAFQRDLNPTGEGKCAAHDWGFIATDVDDPPRCVSECRERFLRQMLPKDETFGRLCEVLGDKDHMDKEQPFRSLYCCDSQLCGVDNLGAIGKDPNINWFINVCQDIGYHSIVDPGPPDSTYTCSHDSVYGGDGRCQQESSEAVTDNAISSESVATSPTASPTEDVSGDNTLTEAPASTSAPIPSSMPDETYSRITDPSLGASMDPSDMDGEVDNAGGLSTGVKITIGLTTVIGIAIIVALAICLLRRRSHKGDIRGKDKHPNSPALAGSPTPLVSPTISHSEADGVQLTPPPPLRERRLLPTLMNQRLSQGGRPPSLSGFPMSPLYSPATSKLTPRHERTPKIRHGDSAAIVPRIVMTAPDGGWKSREDGQATFGRVSPASASNAGSQAEYKNGSPTYPHHSQRRTFNISELVSPGPPPTRALPSTPPNGSGSPRSTASGPNDAGVASGLSLQHPAQVHALNPDAQELCDLTEDYARELRNSWGSWGGGGPGVSVSSLNHGRTTPSQVMREEDLERLGGRY